jgi:hypothetical protein
MHSGTTTTSMSIMKTQRTLQSITSLCITTTAQHARGYDTVKEEAEPVGLSAYCACVYVRTIRVISPQGIELK